MPRAPVIVFDETKGIHNTVSRTEDMIYLVIWHQSNWAFWIIYCICTHVFYNLYNLLNQISAMIFFHYLDQHVWLGITDVVNGDWRWIYDQTTPNYKFWYPGQPYTTSHSASKNYNCAMMLYNHGGKWHDNICSYTLPYLCESNFCKFIIWFRR